VAAELRRNGSLWLVAAGLVILTVRAVRDRGASEVVVLVWAVLPMALMSFGSSKLHHYAYPFVPPLALAAGTVAGWILGAAPHVVDLATARIRFRPGTVVRVVLYGIACAAVIVAVLTIVTGPLHIQTNGGLTLFRNSDPYRPLAIACLCAIVMWPAAKRVLKLSLLIMIVAQPLGAYHDVTRQAVAEHHPLRDLRDCLTRTRARLQASGIAAAGPYVAHADKAMFHSYFYYLRQVGDLGRDIERNDQAILGSLFEKGRERPVLILERDYRATVAAHPGRAFSLVPLIPQPHGLLVLLPGPYAGCVPDRSTSPGLRTARLLKR
jgi:hypothetical protein